MAFTTMAGFGYLVYLTKMESPAAKRSYPYNGLEAELGGSADTPKVSRQLRLACRGRKPGADCGIPSLPRLFWVRAGNRRIDRGGRLSEVGSRRRSRERGGDERCTKR